MRKGTMSEVVTQPSQLDTKNIFVGDTQLWLLGSDTLYHSFGEMCYSNRVLEAPMIGIHVCVLACSKLAQPSKALELWSIDDRPHDWTKFDRRVNLIVGATRINGKESDVEGYRGQIPWNSQWRDALKSNHVPEVRSKSCFLLFRCWLCLLRLCDAERDKSSFVVVIAIHDQSLS